MLVFLGSTVQLRMRCDLGSSYNHYSTCSYDIPSLCPPQNAPAIALTLCIALTHTGRSSVWLRRHVEADRPRETPEGDRGAEETGRRCETAARTWSMEHSEPDSNVVIAPHLNATLYCTLSRVYRDDKADAGARADVTVRSGVQLSRSATGVPTGVCC